jgi:hypothetical protein
MEEVGAGMNWEALGAIGEIVGAVAVILTFDYLAVQVRQNTRAIRAGAHQETTRDATDFVSGVADNADVARILRVGLKDWDNLEMFSAPVV